MADLGEFLRDATKRKREPATWDCSAFPAAWAMACGYADPMAAWRDAYATETDGERLAEKSGGLAALFDQALGSVGVPPTTAPYEPGDVAVISILGRHAGAVFAGVRWAFVGSRGLAFATLDDSCVLRAWRPAHG